MKYYQNCLGGIKLDYENNVNTEFTQKHAEQRIDTNRAIIKKAHTRTIYDIILMNPEGSELRYISTQNDPGYAYPPGKEVELNFVHGDTNQVEIMGGFFTGGRGSSGGGDSDPRSLTSAGTAALSILNTLKFVLATDGSDAVGLPDANYFLAKKSKVHAALTGDELHITKTHDHSDADNGGVIQDLLLSRGVKFPVLPALPLDDTNVNFCIVDNAGTEECYVYLNGSWVKIA